MGDFTPVPTTRLIATGGTADDTLVVAGNLLYPADFDGEEGNDYLAGGVMGDNLLGGPGEDVILGNNGDDTMDGGTGDDELDGGSGDDLMMGGDGDDYMTGRSGNDVMHGGAGIDNMFGDVGNDVMFGDAGNDVMNGGGGNDAVLGGDDNDRLFGGAGNDFVFGGNGADSLIGDAGSDALHGGTTDVDSDVAMLQYLMSHIEFATEVGWGSANSFATRQTDLQAGIAFQGDSGAIDGLNGSTGEDLFVMNGEDTVFRVLADDLRVDL
ncbi:MAG: hypothetical protein KDA71_11190 [Planctomycetales bacterium]|nr:hypothetical protein [Planctomycetales bacterium]